LFFIILLIAWISGFTVFHVAGGLIHLLLVFAVISLILHFVLSKRTVQSVMYRILSRHTGGWMDIG
jgi:hypothetical protein